MVKKAKRKFKRETIGHEGDFFIDVNIKSIFGRSIFKFKNEPIDQALEKLLEFEKFQIFPRKRSKR